MAKQSPDTLQYNVGALFCSLTETVVLVDDEFLIDIINSYLIKVYFNKI
ncbi:hypothetical protein [Sporosarcina sp. FSL K6-1508]